MALPKKIASPPPSAVDNLLVRVDDIVQQRKHSSALSSMRVHQIALFEIAPWDDDQRAIPNVLARAALFTTRHAREPREDCVGLIVYNYNADVHITYTGKELRAADDELVFQQCLEFAKRRLLGAPIWFSFHEMCDAVGWQRNGGAYKRLEACLTRLQASALQIESKRIRRLESLSLIRRFSVHERGTRNAFCEVMIEEDMAVLFAGNHYSKLTWLKYRDLTPTARRLFDWVASHREPYPLKLATFQKMCGSRMAREARWKEHTGDACAELCASELIEDAFVKGDEIVFRRV